MLIFYLALLTKKAVASELIVLAKKLSLRSLFNSNR